MITVYAVCICYSGVASHSIVLGFPGCSAGKESACNAGDPGSIPGLVYPLQYSGLENSMDCIVHGVTKSWTRLSDFHFPSLQIMVEIMKTMAISSKSAYAIPKSAAPRAPAPVTVHC